MAKAINCVNGPTDTPCNVCQNCQTITTGNNLDVIEIDGASNTGIEHIKIIQEEILYPPASSKYKIYIIDEIHMISEKAFNALLKTIEEPPQYVVFIFATTEAHRVLTTIKSRCQQFNLRLIPVQIIYQSLINILNDMKVKYEDLAVRWISQEGKGSMRDAYTLLDQVISFCDGEITMKKIQDKLGLVGEERILGLVKTILEKDKPLITKEYFNLIDQSISPEQIIGELLKFFRNIMIKKANIKSEKLFDFDAKIYEEKLIENFSFDDIENIMEILFQTYEKSKYSPDMEIEIQACIFKLTRYKELIRPKRILAELANIKGELFSGEQKTSEYSSFIEVEKKKEPNVENIKNIENIKSIKIDVNKSEILKSLKNIFEKENIQIYSALNNVISIEEKANTMYLFFSQKMGFDTILKYNDIINNSVSKIVGKRYFVEPIFDENLKQERPKTIAEINAERIKQIFNGREFR